MVVEEVEEEVGERRVFRPAEQRSVRGQGATTPPFGLNSSGGGGGEF